MFDLAVGDRAPADSDSSCGSLTLLGQQVDRLHLRLAGRGAGAVSPGGNAPAGGEAGERLAGCITGGFPQRANPLGLPGGRPAQLDTRETPSLSSPQTRPRPPPTMPQVRS